LAVVWAPAELVAPPEDVPEAEPLVFLPQPARQPVSMTAASTPAASFLFMSISLLRNIHSDCFLQAVS
jgi:hypothetical protein